VERSLVDSEIIHVVMAMVGEEKVCVCEYMWHARTNCCIYFT